MSDIIQAHIQRGESGYLAECFDLPVAAQADSLDEAVEKLHKAIQQYLEGKNLASLGFSPKLSVLVSFHFGPFMVVGSERE